MVCLSVCACHLVLMGFNDSEKGSDAGACLRKMLKGGVLPPRSSGSYSRDGAFSSRLILPPFVWISDEISYITDLGSFLQVHQSSSPLLLTRSRCLGVQSFQGVPRYWWPPSASDPTQTWVSIQTGKVEEKVKMLQWERICWKRGEVRKQERLRKTDCGRGIKWATRDYWSSESAKSALNCKCRSCALNLYNMFVWDGEKDRKER